MKQEYKERVLSNLESSQKRITYLIEMLEKKRPASDKEALYLLNEIQKLLDNSTNVVSIS